MSVYSYSTRTLPDRCERCGRMLWHDSVNFHKLSWFTDEIICSFEKDSCSEKEDEIKANLRKAGLDDHEGCGYVPTNSMIFIKGDK